MADRTNTFTVKEEEYENGVKFIPCLKYDGCIAEIHWDNVDELYYGTIIDNFHSINFHANTWEQLKEEFKNAVETFNSMVSQRKEEE